MRWQEQLPRYEGKAQGERPASPRRRRGADVAEETARFNFAEQSDIEKRDGALSVEATAYSRHFQDVNSYSSLSL